MKEDLKRWRRKPFCENNEIEKASEIIMIILLFFY